MESQIKCPNCGSIVYSRRNILCGLCGEKLPDSVRFDAETRKRIDAEIAQDKKRAEWQAKFPGHEIDSGGMNSI